MFTLTLDARDAFPSLRFFDGLISLGNDTDDEIAEAKEKIANGDIAGGEAEMLGATSKLIRQKAAEDAAEKAAEEESTEDTDSTDSAEPSAGMDSAV